MRAAAAVAVATARDVAGLLLILTAGLMLIPAVVLALPAIAVAVAGYFVMAPVGRARAR